MLYNTDGQIQFTSVSGSAWTGLYAANGNINIVINDGTTWKGRYHPCGAFNAVVVSGTQQATASNGSLNVVVNNYGGYSPANIYGSSAASPAGENFLTYLDNNGAETPVTVTDSSGVEKTVTFYS